MAVLALAVGGCSLASEPVPAVPIEIGPLPGEVVDADLPISLPRASEGALIYLEHCAACHGEGGQGDADYAAGLAEQGVELVDLSDPALARRRSPQDWYRVISDGTASMGGLMPPWRESLTDAERWDVAAYLYTFSAPEDLLVEGEVLYQANCAECHGEAGELEGLDDFAGLATLSREAIYRDYVASQSDEIHTFPALSEDEGLAIALHVQRFGFDAALPAAAEEAVIEEEAPPEEEPEVEAAEAEEMAKEAAEEATQAEPTGVVTGRVTNASAGAEVPAGLEVGLHGITLDASGEVVDFLTQTAATGNDGVFRFEGLPLDVDNAAYVVRVIYDGVEFHNGARIDPDNPVLDLPVTIYETTTDPDVITVEVMHVFMREHPDALLVMQIFVYSNSSDRVFVSREPVSGGRRGSVAVQLPPGALSVTFEDDRQGSRFVQVGDRIYDMDIMPPGEGVHSIIVSYFLDYDGTREVALPVTYTTRQVNMLVQEGQRVRTDRLSPAGVEVFEGQAYGRFVGQDLAAGDVLALKVRSTALGRSTISVVIGAALAALVIVGVIAWFVRGRAWGRVPAAAGLTPDQEALVRQIVELDGAFEAGRVDRFEYEARRADLKAALAEGMEG